MTILAIKREIPLCKGIYCCATRFWTFRNFLKNLKQNFLTTLAFFKNFKKKHSKKFWLYEKENQQLVNPNERPVQCTRCYKVNYTRHKWLNQAAVWLVNYILLQYILIFCYNLFCIEWSSVYFAIKSKEIKIMFISLQHFIEQITFSC